MLLLLSLENQTRKDDIIKFQVEGFAGLRDIREAEEFKKSLRPERKFKLCTQETSKMHLRAHFSSIGAPLRGFPSKIHMELRVAKVTFRDHKAHSRKMIPQLRPPKDNRLSLLRTSRERTMESCGTQWNQPSLLGHHPPMYQDREGEF